MKNKRLLPLYLAVLLAFGLVLSACGGGGSDNNQAPATVSYRVTVTNLTHNQVLSPLAVIFHRQGFDLWEIGAQASVALEVLAEGGDPSDVLTMADLDANVIATGSGSGAITPGSSGAVELSFANAAGLRISLASMLVNTNDAFAGANGRAIANLALNESTTFTVAAYDAGTEANTEGAATIPGPAAGGEGFNALRDDRDFVAIHPGAVTSQDGLAGSALDGSHRWDNPVMRIKVERIG